MVRHQRTRRAILRTAAAGLAAGFAACNGNSGATTPTPTAAEDFRLESPAFAEGASIPTAHTCDGVDRSPPITVADLPSAADSIALIVDDPDAPGATFTHWLLWNVPADTASIPEGIEPGPTVNNLGGARQGENDFGAVGYRGPCPPAGDGPHTYRFTAFAVPGTLSVQPGASRRTLTDALAAESIGSAQFTGEYERG
jgi:hypothetical protein